MPTFMYYDIANEATRDGWAVPAAVTEIWKAGGRCLAGRRRKYFPGKDRSVQDALGKFRHEKQ